MIYANQNLQTDHGDVKINADYRAVNQCGLAHSTVALRRCVFP